MTTPEIPASGEQPAPEDLLSQDARPVRESLGTGGSRLAAAQGWLHERADSGLGRLVSVAAMVAGRDAGYRVGVLQSSPLGEPIYRAIGFEERARFTFATRMPATT